MPKRPLALRQLAIILLLLFSLPGCAHIADPIQDLLSPLMVSSRDSVQTVRKNSQPRVVVDGWDMVLQAIGRRIKTDKTAPSWNYTVQPILNTSGRAEGIPTDMSYLVSASINQIAAGAVTGNLRTIKVRVVSPDAARKDFSSPLTAIYGQKLEASLYKTRPDLVIEGAVHSFDPEFFSAEDGTDGRGVFGGGSWRTDAGGNANRRLKKSRMTVGLSVKAFANNQWIPGVQTNAVIDATESSRRSEISFFLAVVGAGVSGSMSAKADSINKAIIDYAVADLFCKLFGYDLSDFAVEGSSLFLAQSAWFDGLDEAEQITAFLALLRRMQAAQPQGAPNRLPNVPETATVSEARDLGGQILWSLGDRRNASTLSEQYQRLLPRHAAAMSK